ncbi:hypothetical protein Pcinc_020690 [Petrolisthes cinctipes]|uniref:Thymidylate synthase n=1 Tax=Petrolisthes cinctipes TaxID=88211 RepID=A0AAE1FHJ3_PETCI|nr:hypothetical protein Pcinc_020690 [Petrolisthes cinctipes]
MDHHEEYQYLNLIRHILENGEDRGDRTNTGTRSVFCSEMKFSLRDGTVPLLTTKRVFVMGVIEELLWFISGSTDSKVLSNKNVKIWNGNGSRDFLDKRGLRHHEEGDLGPVYGFQWRHSGAKYVDCCTDYTGQGVDQLANVIRIIKNDQHDRRTIINSWNPADLDKMALPPCHILCQFYVKKSELSCFVYQRSADVGLGVPFNIASYSLLTHMVAHVTGLKAGDLIYFTGDTHIYSNHIDALKIQLERKPEVPFPKLRFKEEREDIDKFKYEDFIIEGCEPQSTIKMQMAV